MARPSKLTDEQWEQVGAWDRAGESRAEIARKVEQEFGVSMTRAGVARALGKRAVNRPAADAKILGGIRVTEEEASQVRAVAASLGYKAFTGPQTGEGSISALLRAIALGDVQLKRRK